MANVSKKENKGIALFFAVVIVSVSLAVALGLSDLVVGELFISRDNRDSQRALYAADSGIECMLTAWRESFWSLTPPVSPVTINCFGQAITFPPATGLPPNTVRQVLVNLAGGACVHMEVKLDSSFSPPVHYFTSRGQSSCVAGTRSVQRGIRAVQL